MIPQHIICTLYCVHHLKSIAFHQHFSPHTLFSLLPTCSLWQSLYCSPCPSVFSLSFLLNPSTPPTPHSPPTPKSVSIFYEFESILLACSFCLLASTYEWNYMTLVFLWLAYFSVILSSFIHVVTKGKISFFFAADSIPLCKCTTAFLSTRLLTDTWATSRYLLL